MRLSKLKEEAHRPRGRVRLTRNEIPQGPWSQNLILYEWATIVARNLIPGQFLPYTINGMYFEFANLASPGVVTPPSYDRTGGVQSGYYSSLQFSPTADYMRVRLSGAVIDTSDPLKYPLGNIMRFFAQAMALEGVHGKPFGQSHNSTVYGVALTAQPIADDPTQDLIFSRYYFLGTSQAAADNVNQIGAEWDVTLL